MADLSNGGEELNDVAKDAAGGFDQAKDAAADKAEEVVAVASDKAQDVKQTLSNTADDLAVSVDKANGKGVAFGIGAAALAVGAVWIAYRVTKASVKRHPAVRVARSAVHAVRER